MVVLMNRNDIIRLGLINGSDVRITTVAHDNVLRTMDGFRVTEYDIPEGCVGTYYPEANALIPLWHHADRSKVPAAKSVPVRIIAQPAVPEMAAE
jgi:anaerobic selenocysteine-containing dehydrogenase